MLTVEPATTVTAIDVVVTVLLRPTDPLVIVTASTVIAITTTAIDMQLLVITHE